ncbi:phosphoribosylanthranilate isomerase [Falsibacillus pallidus]|uniref:N-(5'-phosphoribosyl)anthranilate isomerase n=1 Tax=Falsibacillus pallidus TaxID=493781 RepID=A0A370GHL9_9BACI|nr:phosphoribosylanthranilate isomerase [Falsibacillus pallidus]RDI43151.1 phosphoribosylanthranilate isomerase [Falsibacillus pallidus]
MKVKVCGIKTVEAGLEAVRSGADAIGFVFAESKRRISIEAAREISRKVPQHVKKIGVFVNEELEVINRCINEANLDFVQLHGDETPEFCSRVKIPVVKSFSIRKKEDLNRLSSYQVDYYLLDSPAGKYRGGNGTSFDWSLLKDLSKSERKIILAGGLTIENVVEAINIVKPEMIDVSSGVETDGEKDPIKMQKFTQMAKEAFNQLEGN